MYNKMLRILLINFAKWGEQYIGNSAQGAQPN